jgi:UDP-glucose 4-epimerase
MSKRILVTGGAGFIGSHMADGLLAQGHDVVIIDNERWGHRDNVPKDAEYIVGDVRHLDDLEPIFAGGLDAVFHIAGEASTIRSFDTPLNDLNVNTVGTINIIQKCLEHSVPRLLFASSMTAYGLTHHKPIGEDTPCSPISYYGISKYAAERYVLASAARPDLEKPFHATCFRMFNVYGERQRLDNPYQGVMGIFIGNVLREETVRIFGDGLQSRDFIHIDDVVSAWVKAWQSPSAYNQVFNLGIGEDTSMTDLVKTIMRQLGHDPEKYPISYEAARPGDQRFMAADIERAKTLLDWEPVVGLNAGILRTINWAKENG